MVKKSKEKSAERGVGGVSTKVFSLPLCSASLLMSNKKTQTPLDMGMGPGGRIKLCQSKDAGFNFGLY